jgi:hypothetical protein
MTGVFAGDRGFWRVFGLAFALLCVWGMCFGARAWAVGDDPGWELSAQAYPTYFAPGGRGTIDIDVFNVGAATSEGTITVTDTLPVGVEAVDAGELDHISNGLSPKIVHALWECAGNAPGGVVEGASVVTCTSTPGFHFDGGGGAPFGGAVVQKSAANLQPRVGIAVRAGVAASGLVNRVTIAGGGALVPASTEDPVTVSSGTPPFGFVGWDGWFSNADGTLDTQAGSHPYEATFTFDLADAIDAKLAEGYPAGGAVRDVEVQLPPGLIGNPKALPECPRGDLVNETCPQASEVGVSTAYLALSSVQEIGDKVFNMVPPPGVPAELGFVFEGILVFLDSDVRSGSDYGITTHANEIPQREIISDVLTLWNDPGEASHNLWRGGRVGGCSAGEIDGQEDNEEPYCKAPNLPALKPFFTLPTSCEGALPFVINADTWQNTSVTSHAEFEWHDSNGSPVDPTGCEDLAFGPTITTEPDSSEADMPAGLNVEVKPPLGGLEEPAGLGTADIKGSRVTLPEGFVVNPGQAAGLQACSESQSAVGSEAAPSCPAASKVGTIEAQTPLLEGEGTLEKQMKGSIYVLQSNPPQIKLLAALSADGVNVKLVLDAELNTATGQITTTVSSGIPQFPDIPQFPVSDFKLSFDGGAKAALATPTTCGTYTTSTDFTPWSSPLAPDFLTGSSFQITSGAEGAACPSSLPFAPSLSAGSTSDQAGAYTGFSLLLQNPDDNQRVSSFQVKMPPGLTGIISKITPCPEPQASLGTCPASSQIGHTIATSGPGNDPLVIPQPGEPEAPIYLTGPYNGHASCTAGTPECAPFGLTVVVPVIAGPFNLGDEIIRSRIEIDPRTAQITATTNPLPQIIKGVPTDVRAIDAVIDRPEFMLNPTSCSPQQLTGTATSTTGTSTALASRFQVGSCRTLEFHPKIQVTVGGHASKADGAGVKFKISYPAGAQGSESWLNEMKIDLPKQLPARLETLQKACLAAVFEANPAGCPAASEIGTATVHTPLLPVPLAGPVYFVSYGGAKFPEAVIVLQGDNVTVDLHGETFISKGITSATFRNIPGVPFENTEVNIPTGRYSEFGTYIPVKANYNLCGQNLLMPTLFTAQNGLEIHQTTKITVTGCPKHKASKPKHKKKHKKK